HRFNGLAPAVLDEPDPDATTLRGFLDRQGFSPVFRERYLFPLAASIWSAALPTIEEFPAATLVRFFPNHGMLSIADHPTSRVVAGGSASYVPKLTAPLGDRVRAGAGVHAVARDPSGVRLTLADGATIEVDDVVFACHGDEVLPMLADASPLEREVLGAFR